MKDGNTWPTRGLRARLRSHEVCYLEHYTLVLHPVAFRQPTRRQNGLYLFVTHIPSRHSDPTPRGYSIPRVPDTCITLGVLSGVTPKSVFL